MGLNYRKRMKIAPGVHVNISKKGVSSVSVGKRGASMNFNKQGHQASFGIPGSGISYTSKRSGSRGHGQSESQNGMQDTLRIEAAPVTTQMILDHKPMALNLLNYLGVNYDPSLNKNPWFKSKKVAQRQLLEQYIANIKASKLEDLQLKLNLEQALREFGLLRFAAKYNFDMDNCTLYDAGVIVCIANENNLTKKARKNLLEDTIIELV